MLINPYVFAGFDVDALAYLAAVEAADGQELEVGVRSAVNNFVVGCKSDGIWGALKSSCILAGARTLSGALVPLLGPAPTNNNLVSGDYNRKNGCLGNGANKYINTNYNSSSLGQNDFHNAIYCSELPSSSTVLIGANSGSSSELIIGNTSSNAASFRCRDATTRAMSLNNAIGFRGASRSVAGSYTVTMSSTTQSITGSSTGTSNRTHYVLAQNNSGAPASFTNARLSFYSIGSSLNLALLDSRVTTLINAIAAAIP